MELNVRPDDFLSAVLSRRCGNAIVFSDSTEKQLNGFLARQQDFDFLTIKVSPGVYFDELPQGAAKMPSQVTFSGIVNLSGSRLPDGWSLGPAESSERKKIVELARRSFSLSRFHSDLEISKKDADEVKAAWVDNFFQGKRGERLTVARSEAAEIAGFCLVERGQKLPIVDLICVSSQFRGVGIGKMLLSSLENRVISVGTQVNNIPAIALYQAAGLSLTQTQTVMHWHSTETDK